MKYASTFILSLLFFTIYLQTPASAEEIEDGRVRLYIKAADPNNGKLFFLWKQLEGPSVKIADPAAAQLENGKWISDTYFIPTEPGKYSFEISVKNEEGIERKKIIVREILPPTPPPVAIAGKDQTKTVGEMVVINGVDSKAAEGQNIAEWNWRLTESPELFKLDAKKLKERQFDFKAQEPGVYQFELRVSDGKRWSVPSRMMVTIKPASLPPIIEESVETTKIELPPIPEVVAKIIPVVKAVVTSGRTIKLGEPMVLDGSGSIADETLCPEFYWRPEKGPIVRQSTPDKLKPFSKQRLADPLNYPVLVCTPTQPGEYIFVLEISIYPDGRDNAATKTESDPVRYIVENVNTPPIANVFTEQTSVEVGKKVRLNGSRSTDPEGDKLEYLWGPVVGKRYPKSWAGIDGPEVEFQAEEEGQYSVALIVSDGKIRSASAQIEINVGPANQPPRVTLPKTYECVVGDQLRIEADVKDPENDHLDMAWTCLDPADLVIPDKLARNDTLVFVPKNPGTFLFKITATDAKGLSAFAQTMVGVKEAVNHPPTAIIDGPMAANTLDKLKLSGSRSSDPERKPLSYHWKQDLSGNGPRISTNIPGEEENSWEFTPSEPGRYSVSLMVSDGVNKSEPCRFEVLVSKLNATPIAKISGLADVKIPIGEKIVLDGSASSDPDNEKLTYRWRKSEGTGDITITGGDQDHAEITGGVAGSVRIELIVNDGTVDSQPAVLDLSVIRPNHKPVAHISGPPTAKAGSTIELNAAESSDPDGDEITSYLWSQSASGGPETGLRGRDLRRRELRIRPEKPGTYVFNLEVVDARGLKSELVSHTLELKGVNRPPLAKASREGTDPVFVGGEVKLSARGSLDPEGGPLTYNWKQISGTALPLPKESAEVINVAPQAPGEYEFECIVNDGENDSLSARIAFNVQIANQSPIAIINEIIPCEPGEQITLDGTLSHDPNSDRIAEYRWIKVSGPDASFGWRGDRKPKIDVILPKEGEYVFELKVFDGKVWSEPARAAVKTSPHNTPPVAALEIPNVRTEENVETVLDATASSDPDNGPRPLTFIWRQLDGLKVDLRIDGPRARFVPKKPGALTFQVKAFDGKAESLPTDVKVIVLKSGSLPVAVPVAKPNPVKVAQKGVKNNPTTLLVLDGTQSKSQNRPLTYAWKQVAGDDLHLPAANLAKDRVGILFYVAGEYRFMLTVSDAESSSQPAFVDVKVVDEVTEPGDKKPAPDETPETRKANPGGADDAPRKEGAWLPPPKDRNAVADGNVEEEHIERTNQKNTQKKILENLARQQDPEAEKKLVTALSDEDGEIRSTAAAALYRRGINGIPALIGVLESENPHARREACWALKELTHENMGQDAAKWKQWWAAQPMAKNFDAPNSGVLQN